MGLRRVSTGSNMGAWALGFLLLTACSGKDDAAPGDGPRAEGDAASTVSPEPADAGAHFNVTTPEEGADASDPVADPTAPADGGAGVPPTGDAAASPDVLPVPSCTPDPAGDQPDENFADTNCDGIDGDASHAVFVAPTGSDDAAGGRDAPVATLSRALELARTLQKDVYVCNGTYEEAVSILDKAVRVYGGYACDRAWRRVPDRAVVAPKVGPALTVRNVREPVVLERLWFRAESVSEPGKSSIAAVIVDADDVTLSRLAIEAGDGAVGVAGGPPTDPGYVVQPRAADAPDTEGATECVTGSSCTGYVSGGLACLVIPEGATSLPAQVCRNGTVIQGGAGGKGSNCAWGVRPEEGQPGIGRSLEFSGLKGESGSPGSVGFSHLHDGDYVPDESAGDGKWGYAGFAGKGGDGAYSHTLSNGDVESDYGIGGGGGQGGFPGCGGRGGRPGHGGGASIGVVIQRSRVSVVWSRIITGRGGDGGAPSAGLAGQLGGPGGHGGAGTRVVKGGDGEPGGNGGEGGLGGPGAGGPSVGIAYDLTPTLEDTTFTLGEPGSGAVADSKAVDGVVAETLLAAAY